MSAATEMDQVVTPAKVRRRVREQQRGPVARPVQLTNPARRPVQPSAPGAGAPVRLRQAPVRVAQRPSGRRPGAAPAGVQLTDRGLALVLGLIVALVLATVVVGVVKFFGVSNAPLHDGGAAQPAPMSATVG